MTSYCGAGPRAALDHPVPTVLYIEARWIRANLKADRNAHIWQPISPFGRPEDCLRLVVLSITLRRETNGQTGCQSRPSGSFQPAGQRPTGRGPTATAATKAEEREKEEAPADPLKHVEAHILPRLDPGFVDYYLREVIAKAPAQPVELAESGPTRTSSGRPARSTRPSASAWPTTR